jgi:DNA modification methylase
MSVTILKGDCRDILKTLPDQSVHCCVTSPPYFGLRSYDENSVRIDPSLDQQTYEWLVGELIKRGINAR